MINKAFLSLVSLVMFLLTPFVALFALVYKMVTKKDFHNFDMSKQRNMVSDHIIRR